MVSLKSYEENDPDFVEDLKRSDKHVDKVVAWLKAKGIHAVKRPLRIREKIEEMSKFSDKGDIEAVVNGSLQRIEAKQRFIKFTSKEDFPYDTIIVDVAHAWEKANPKPMAYILTNRSCTVCLVVSTKTSDRWIKKKRWDSKKRRMRVFYECPIELTKFHRM